MRQKRAKPLYEQVQDFVLNLISGPEYAPGERIPSERQLAEQLGINRMTVRKAIDRLVERRVLERNGTSGTRVPLPKAGRAADIRASMGVTRVIRNASCAPTCRLLHFGEAQANESLAQKLDMPIGAELLMFRRLYSNNAIPFCIETSYLPAERFPDLMAEHLTGGQSLSAVLAERYGLRPASADREISVGAPTEAESRLLGLDKGEPTLVLRVVARDDSGRPFEYMDQANHPHHVTFRVSAAGAAQ